MCASSGAFRASRDAPELEAGDVECEGGGWHGKGGYVDVDDPSVWAQLLVAFAALSVIGILAHACYRYAKIRRRTKRFYAAQAAAAAPMPPAPASPKPTVGEGDIESVAL